MKINLKSLIYILVFSLQFSLNLESKAENSINSDNDIILLQGETFKIPAKDKIWIENKENVDVTDLKTHFLIKGIKPGRSFIRVGQNIYQFSILSVSQEKTFQILSKVLPTTLGLKLSTEKGDLMVTGNLFRWLDWQKLADACEKQNCSYQMAAKINSDLSKTLEVQLNQILTELSLPVQKFQWQKPLQVSLFKNSLHATRLQNVLQSYGFKINWVEDALQTSPLIRVHITLAEVKREDMLDLGLGLLTESMNNAMEGKVVADSITSGSGKTEKLFAKLQILEQQGSSKTLASPNILCKSGKSAEFFAGGEIPIRVITRMTKEIIWKKYGIQLKVQPEADFSGRMSIAIETEVSALDQANALDGIPAMTTNQLKSHFDLNDSKIIVLSGLIKNDEGSTHEGVIGLSSLPVLGPLFASQNFRNRQSELIVLVKPEIVKE